MLYHLIPRIYSEYADVAVSLVGVRIPALGLVLCEGKEIVARKPYANKRYLVVCRKVGRKAINGLLVEGPAVTAGLSVITRWALDAETVVEHAVSYYVNDTDNDCISDSPLVWSSFLGFKSRWPAGTEHFIPCRYQPRMDVIFNGEESEREGDVVDTFSDGILVARKETFIVPTIEDFRLATLHAHWPSQRLPQSDDRFICG